MKFIKVPRETKRIGYLAFERNTMFLAKGSSPARTLHPEFSAHNSMKGRNEISMTKPATCNQYVLVHSVITWFTQRP